MREQMTPLERMTAPADVSMIAPFSVCASVLGTEKMLRWMVREKEALHTLMEIITRNNEEYIKALASLGFSTGFCDPVYSTDLISPKQYEEFSFPYFTKNVKHVNKYCKGEPNIHICVHSKALWSLIKDIGIGNFSIDNCESPLDAKEAMGNTVTITGNVPPVEVMYLGSPADVEEAVKKCIDEGIDNPNGYILSTGCQIPKGTKIENIDAFMETRRKFGILK